MNVFRPQLPADLSPDTLPKHIALIMDGNGRWAQQRGIPRIAGHRQGAKTLKALVRCCKAWGIQRLTTYAFSTENWQRPPQEVNFLMRLFERLLQTELEDLQREGVKLSFIGDLSVLAKSLQYQMEQAVKATARNQSINLTVAINYGSRAELTQACRHLAYQVEQGRLQASAIDESLLEQSLYTSGMEEPDLLIRTSGEQRVSNYLLWQLAYTELYFTDTLWPDFDETMLHQALKHFQGRTRRFGQLNQLNSSPSRSA